MLPTRTDLYRALRRLERAPGFTALSLLTLGVGLGAVVALATLVYGVLLQPLPYTEADRLVTLWHTAPSIGVEEYNQSHGTYTLYRRDAEVFEDVALFNTGTATLTEDGEPAQVLVASVSSSLFPVLGVAPVHGRGFTADEDAPGAPSTVVLSHALWQERFGGDPGVLGRSMRLDGELWEIVGILPEGFAFPEPDIELYAPHPIDPAELGDINYSYNAVARLKPEVTVEVATAELNRLLPRLPEAFPGELSQAEFDNIAPRAYARPLYEDVVGDVQQVLWVLLATAALVLGVAGANVANLFLARAEGRQREVAVVTALGASRRDLARGFFAEALLLAGGAGVLALGFAWAVTRVLPILAPDGLPRLQEIGLHPPVLAVAAGLTVVTALVLALVPLLRFGRLELSTALKEGGRGADAGKATRWSREMLVVVQVAASLVLVAGSVLMLRSFQELTRVDPGFAKEGVLTFFLSLPEADYEGPREVNAFHRRLFGRLEALPGVRVVGGVRNRPLTDGEQNTIISIQDQPTPEDELPPVMRTNYATPGYFEAMGIPLFRGRTFEPRELEEARGSVVVSRSFAERFWGVDDAIGKRVSGREGPPWYTVVGVVGDVHDDSLTVETEQMIYFPPRALPEPANGEEGEGDRGWTLRYLGIAVQASGRPEALIPQIRQAVWDLDPNLPLTSFRTTAELVERSTARTAFTATLLALAAAAALLLGTVGLYAVVAYLVTRRTREIGVRMALGARRGDVQSLVVRQGMRLGVFGVVLGLACALAAARTLDTLLFGVAATDAATYAAASVGLLVVTAVASYLPARRASAVDPAIALRRE